MSKKTNFYIISGIIFFSLLSMTGTIVAWKNGLNTIGTGHGTIGNDPIPIYKADYTKSITANTLRKYYGTHDWIAESALELLYGKLGSPTSGFLYQLWNVHNPDNLRIYYLFGTELPDHRVPSGLTTRCNFEFSSAQFYRAGHNKLRFFDDPSSPFYKFFKDDSACQSANNLYFQIVDAFKDKDCQAAAAFIGALMHVIADATYFYHVIDDIDTDLFNWHVMHVTFRTWADVSGDRSNEFFNLAEAIGKVTAADMFNPYQATLLAGKNTRFGSLLYQDAEFLLYSDPTGANKQFWSDVQGYWTDYSQENSWTHSMRPSIPGTSAKKYFDTVEHNLNQAVYYCATALNFILNFAGYSDCDCGPGSEGQNTNPPPSDRDGEGLKDGIQLSVDQVIGLIQFNFMGLLATLIAISLISKTKLLEEVLPL